MISEENKKVLEKTTYAEYLRCTCKLIKTLAPTVYSGLERDIFRAADGIETICYAVIKADVDFNGKGSRYGFRKSRALYAIKSYSTYLNKKRYKKFPKYSLNFATDTKSQFLYSTLSTLATSPEDEYEKKEEIAQVNEIMQTFSPFAQKCIELYYLYSCSLKEISKQLNKSHEWVRITLNQAIKTIRSENEKREKIKKED